MALTSPTPKCTWPWSLFSSKPVEKVAPFDPLNYYWCSRTDCTSLKSRGGGWGRTCSGCPRLVSNNLVVHSRWMRLLCCTSRFCSVSHLSVMSSSTNEQAGSATTRGLLITPQGAKQRGWLCLSKRGVPRIQVRHPQQYLELSLKRDASVNAKSSILIRIWIL